MAKWGKMFRGASVHIAKRVVQGARSPIGE